MMIGMGLGMVDRDIEVGKEYKVGTFTLNGVTYDRYVKIVDCGAMPNNTNKTIPHGIDGTIVSVLSISGIMSRSVGDFYTIPFVNPATTIQNAVAAWVDNRNTNRNIIISTKDDWSAFNALVVLEYCK